MSISTEVTVWCDEPDCHVWTYGDGTPGRTRREARASARRLGWSNVGGADYCPSHGERARSAGVIPSPLPIHRADSGRRPQA